jgi:hypothetical protein
MAKAPKIKCGKSMISQKDRQKLDDIKVKLSSLGKEIISKMEAVYNENVGLGEQMNINYDEFKKNLDKYKNIDKKLQSENNLQSSGNIEGMKTMNDINAMLTDTDLIVLQENYRYMMWSILAVGTLAIAVNSLKK